MALVDRNVHYIVGQPRGLVAGSDTKERGGGAGGIIDTVVSHWPLNEASGTRFDLHGSNDLTAINGVGSRTGKIGNGVDFPNGSGDALHLAAPAAELKGGERDFSVAGWALRDLSFIASFIVSHASSAADNNVDYWLQSTGAQWRWAVGRSDGPGGEEAVVTTGSWNNSEWYFLAASFNVTTRKIKLSVNDGTPFEFTTIGTRKDFGGRFQMGTHKNGTVGDSGNDEFSFFASDIFDTPSIITDLYNGGAGLAYADW